MAGHAPSPDQALIDHRLMGVALRLGERGLGRVAPNPAVGCVLVRPENQSVVGRGWTQPGGRPHGETEALARAGQAARGATAYVTLEPCAHQGKTPPCAQALIDAGVGRVVVGFQDPDPRVAGRGVAMLEAAGISVDIGVRAAEAEDLTRGFVTRLTRGRPLVTVKIALSMDGRIAAAGGASQWITGAQARVHAHGLRARHDAIMVGSETALRDDPSLSCRLPGMAERSPIRIIVDGALRVPETHHVMTTAGETPTWLITGEDRQKDPKTLDSLRRREALGVMILPVKRATQGHLDLKACLQALGAQGLTRLMVEGGGRLIAALFEAGLVDELVVYRAPVLIGGDGVAAVASLGVTDPGAAPRFEVVERRALGRDMLEVLRPLA